MSIKRLRHRHSKADRRKHEEEQAARLAPLEEIHASRQPQPAGEGNGGGGGYNDGSIKVDSSTVKLNADLTEAERAGGRIFHLEPVVVAILLIMLSFIAFIAWQITLMPEKAG